METKRKRPTKKELVAWKISNELGFSANAIAAQAGRSHHTVSKYLRSDVYADPQITEIVERIRKKEIDDLEIIRAKARQRIHDIFDTGKPALIPTVAALDRTFQKKRLLQGKSTENFSNLTAIIQAAHGARSAPKENKNGNRNGKVIEATVERVEDAAAGD